MQTIETLQTTNPNTALTPLPGPASNVVLERIKDCLSQSNYREMRGVSCEFRAGTAILQGRVCSFYAKQTAQELIRRVDGVIEIQNHLEVE